MENFYYSKSEGIAFWARYTGDQNTRLVHEQVKYLMDNADVFANAVNVPYERVCTDVVLQSSRFRYMRVFYAKIDGGEAPSGAFQIREDQTMWDFLKF